MLGSVGGFRNSHLGLLEFGDLGLGGASPAAFVEVIWVFSEV